MVPWISWRTVRDSDWGTLCYTCLHPPPHSADDCKFLGVTLVDTVLLLFALFNKTLIMYFQLFHEGCSMSYRSFQKLLLVRGQTSSSVALPTPNFSPTLGTKRSCNSHNKHPIFPWTIWTYMLSCESKVTAIQAKRVPEVWGSQISRQSAHESGKIVSRTHRPPLLPGNILGTHCC